MSTVKLGLSGMPVPDKIQFARQVVLDMTGNPNYTTPAPTLASLTTAATALETAYNTAQTSRQVAKANTSTQDIKDGALDLVLSQMANYVENTSGGDKAKIESAGFGTRNVPAPIGDLPAPLGLAAVASDLEGTVDLSWNRVKGSSSYTIQKAADAVQPLVWNSVAVATKGKATVNSMTPGAKYWFRVAAVGAAGQSPWSDPVPKIAQ